MSKKLISGNEAIVLGAQKAGVGFFAGYPITPASEIMHKFASTDIPFVHCEDEISSINMIIGASMAGKKALTATSGPGYSLMQESIGYAHMTETPIVIVNSQRVGPSTGMPTLPAQGDIMQSRYGTHGDVNPIVFAPNSVEECFSTTIHAFNAAEQSLSPVTILLDAFLSQMYEPLDKDLIDIKVNVRNKKALGKGVGYLTGLLSKNGTPQTKNTDYYRVWFKKNKEKMENAAKNYNLFEFIENKNSDTLLVAFGTPSRVISSLKEKYSIFRPIRLFPILDELKDVAKNYKKIVAIEMNDGQYATALEAFLKRKIKKINILGGDISLKEIMSELRIMNSEL